MNDEQPQEKARRLPYAPRAIQCGRCLKSPPCPHWELVEDYVEANEQLLVRRLWRRIR